VLHRRQRPGRHGPRHRGRLDHGRLDKLEIYRRLGIGEVWIWEEGRIGVHLLRGDSYERVERSSLLPDLDIEQVASFLDRPTALQAVRAFQEALRTAPR
jgi:Uma2 family endonuclease